ncbi:hypothetical protein LSH36_315g05048 [Paralvinella palmiformis]|uniref:OCEL domain-containing protein n=1 Tax=Paralvinella palmiformis TaxID=53620 RepID=A0AAD9JHT7_9ANNE|nr:hypothetical protein LSH36_315g05048 [Paralvinella palmiformis]
MADLAEGRQYGLSSENATNKNKSVLHVKLTDSALKALQEYQRIKDATTDQKASIQFQGSNGVIKVPVSKKSDSADGLRTFTFSLSTIPTDPNGSFECFKQSARANELNLMGVLQQKVSIRATDDSYHMTRERMTQAEEESKKQRAKEIKPSGLGVGRRVRKVIRNTTTTSASRPTSLPNLHKTCSPSNIHVAGKKEAGILNVPLRERIIHILALRPYKKPELLLKLQKDGIRSNDKNSISSVLNQVGKFNPRDNNFTLPKYLLPEVRSDWPFYTETDKQLLKRRLAQMNESPSSNTSPVVSPCNSTSSQGSPVNAQKHLIPEPKPSDQPAKKRRVAHINHKEPAEITKGNLVATGIKPTHSSLHEDDVNNHDKKNPVSSVLNQVGNISLKDNLADKKLLKRRLNHFNESALSSTSPAVSPCHSTGSQGSPTNSQKNVITNEKPHDQLVKKRRIVPVNHKEPADVTKSSLVSTVGKPVKSSLPESPSNNNQENKIIVDSDNLDVKPDYLRSYPKISSSDQRQTYKADFNAEYEEYRQLHSRIMAVTNKFLELKEQLQKQTKGSSDYKNICKRIKCEFKLVKGDPKYLEQRHRHDYLHHKLGHIKKLISEYDKSRFGSS